MNDTTPTAVVKYPLRFQSVRNRVTGRKRRFCLDGNGTWWKASARMMPYGRPLKDGALIDELEASLAKNIAAWQAQKW